MSAQALGKGFCLERQPVREACGRGNQATVENTSSSSLMSFSLALCLWYPAQDTCFKPTASRDLCFTPDALWHIPVGITWAISFCCIPGTLSSTQWIHSELCTPRVAASLWHAACFPKPSPSTGLGVGQAREAERQRVRYTQAPVKAPQVHSGIMGRIWIPPFRSSLGA